MKWCNCENFILVLSNLKIGFLGAGRMSQALAGSLIERNVVSSKDQIIASDIDENQRKLATVSYWIYFKKNNFWIVSIRYRYNSW